MNFRNATLELLGFNDRVGFDLDEPIGVDEATHHDQRAGRTYVPEELAMHFGHLLPVVDSGQVDPGANDVRQR